MFQFLTQPFITLKKDAIENFVQNLSDIFTWANNLTKHLSVRAEEPQKQHKNELS